MAHPGWRLLGAACALALSAPLLAAGDAAPADLSQRLLAVHNDARRAIGVAPLTWSERLASSAADWARHLVEQGELRHAPVDTTLSQGENLWAGTHAAYTPEDMVSAWIAERSDFTPGTVPDVSRTRNWAGVGHYSQVIWRDTHEVGCAIASSAREDILVCRYANAGNVVGQRPY